MPILWLLFPLMIGSEFANSWLSRITGKVPLVDSIFPVSALIGHLEKKQVASMHPHGPDPICDMRRNVGFYQAKLFLCQWQLMPSL
jgi:hypothetical protein